MILPTTALPRLKQSLGEIPRICQGFLSSAENISLFFDLLQEARIDAAGKYRIAFWQNYLEQGAITESWLVLGTKLTQLASKRSVKPYQFGTLQKSLKVEDNHGVLLLALKGVLAADWSHLGRCRFWKKTNSMRPFLYQTSYPRNDLYLGADHIQQHYFSAKGLWQEDAKYWINSQR